MQTASSRIWIRVSVSISFDDNHFTSVASSDLFVTEKTQLEPVILLITKSFVFCLTRLLHPAGFVDNILNSAVVDKFL